MLELLCRKDCGKGARAEDQRGLRVSRHIVVQDAHEEISRDALLTCSRAVDSCSRFVPSVSRR